MSATAAPYVIAVDTGGTFTDLIRVEGGRLERLKIPSTPADPSQAILDGLARLVPPGQPFVLLHGSTVATNALLERTGSRVMLVTNRGFEDVLEIGRQNRPQLYALVGSRPPPLVSRDDRVGIAGRLDHSGEELEPLDADELAGLAERLSEAEAVAVVLLHSYANGDHEEQVVAALAGVGVPVSVSHRILPEYREYERTSTTVVNAYVGPEMADYLARIERDAGAERFRVMGSDGGALSVGRARKEPVRTVLSGPAGGVVGGREWGKRSGVGRVITFDMGGTSTDVSICPDRMLHTRETTIGGQPVAVPVLDIYTVGAGGGSIAWLDPAGALRVGPASAGAEPGPICYGGGGRRVTVTDANVWLGRLPADAFLGGGSRLDRDAIEPHLRALAERLDLTLEATAQGVLEIAEAAMAGALRVISVERGFDPARFALVAFGGAGGLHAVRLAETLGVERVIVPPDPGLLSAFGILTAPVRREETRTLFLSTDDHGDLDGQLARVRAELDRTAREKLREEVPDGRLKTEHSVDVRYRGQSYEMRVPAESWLERFHQAHHARYGYSREGAAVELIAVRVAASVDGLVVETRPPRGSDTAEEEVTRVWWEGEWHQARRVWRNHLAVGSHLRGPAVVLEYSSTTWVPGGWRLTVEPSGSLGIFLDV